MVAPLPAPTGSFAVGRTVRDWTDPTRTDPYATDPYATEPAGPRSLVTWIWYPCDRPAGATDADYLPPAWLPAGQLIGIDTVGLLAHSVDDAPVSGAHPTYPVVLLSPSGFPPLLLSGTAEALASNGFVVVGVNHTYETPVTVFGDGRVVPMNPAAIAGALGPAVGDHREVFAARAEVCRYKALDLAFLADSLAALEADDPLAGRLDLNRLSAVGHSFGGAAALHWLRDDPRCTAAVNLDGALWTEIGRDGLERPALQILAPHPEFDVTPAQAVAAGIAPDPEWFAAERSITVDGWATVGRTACTVQVTGASHVSFMDVPFLPLTDASPVRPLVQATAVDPARALAVTTALLVAFLSGGYLAPVLDSDAITVLSGW